MSTGSSLELNIKDPVPSDIEISRNQKPKKITRVAQELGILDAELEPYGHFKAKVDPKSVIERLDEQAEGSAQDKGNYIWLAPLHLWVKVKSTTTMGLTQALGAHLGYNAIAKC